MMSREEFDLDRAVAEWRRPYEGQRRYSTQDIDELEQHLRDEIEQLVSEGHAVREAFLQASKEVGDAWAGEVEYEKVYWGKIRHPSRSLNELGFGLSLLVSNARSAARNLTRHRAYALTNLAGLTIAIAGCLLVLLYIRLELSRGTDYPKADRIYRVVSWTLDSKGDRTHNRGSDGRIGPALLETFPEVEQVLRSQTEWPMRVRAENRTIQEQAVSVMDPSVIDVLDLPFVSGDPGSALSTPDGVILRKSTARALFGEQDPIGKTVTLADHWGGDYTVTGIVEDPAWTIFALNFSFLTTRRTHNASSWDRVMMGSSFRPIQTFILLREGADLAQLNARLDEMNLKVNGEEWAGKAGYELQPLTRIHLYGHHDYPGILAFGNIRTVYTLSAIAVFVLVVACANFVNLTTARFAQRTREIGIRKAVGAGRRQLIVQFLSESILLTMGAGMLAIVVAQLSLPTFATYLERQQHLSLEGDTTTWVVFWLLTLTVGAFAGLYPALVTTRLHPSHAISGKQVSIGGIETRRVLVGTQFVISIVLITSTIVLRDQVDYLVNQDIGMDRTNIIWIPVLGSDRSPERRAEVARVFRQHPNVVGTSFTGRVPVFEYKEKVAAEGDPEPRSMVALEGDEDLVELLNIEILDGRNFSRQHLTDEKEAVLLNETAVRELGWEIGSPDPAKNPLGKTFEQFRFKRKSQVVGVVRLHLGNLRGPAAPAFIRIRNSGMGNILVRMRPENISETMTFLDKTRLLYRPNTPFRYRFLDGAVEHVYRMELQVRDVSTAFFVLAIVIACIGLFALVALTVEQRTKELGIRKTVGASAVDLFVLLTRGFLTPVCIACLIGWPITYYMMNDWLSDYAHRIDLNVIPFLIGSAGAMGSAFLTVGYRTLKTARISPVDALRCE